jgi:RimJ/RimL family protein N-acetyltransferase
MARLSGLTTERLHIRNLEPGDADAFFAYKSMPDATRYQFWRPHTMDEIRDFIQDMQSVEPDTAGTWLQLAVCLKNTDVMIGDVGLHFLPGEGEAEIGYTISLEHQHKGYATEAVRAVVGYLFHTLGKRRVTASVDPRNTPSAAVLERLGFRMEAHFRKSILMDGEWCDDCVYAILAEDWEKMTGE